jgi:uncharacterized protein (DUF2062 family)
MNLDIAWGRTTARRSLHRLRTEGDTPARQAAAFGLGAFIGCSPVYGFHLPLCLFVGWLFRLNRLKMYLGANISNPLVAPFLIFSEVQLGHLARVGSWYPISLEAFRGFNAWYFGADLLLGSVIVGGILGILAAGATFVLVRRRGKAESSRLISDAVDRYVESGVFAWESANGKLRLDPVYLEVLRRGLLPDDGTLVDLGCGRGLMLSLLVSARRHYQAGTYPAGWPVPPLHLALRGVELRPRIAADASLRLASDAVVERGDVRTVPLPASRAVLLFDVLHMIPYEDQDVVLDHVAAALQPGGTFVLREADAAGGWRFRIIHLGNWWKGVFEANPGRRFYFRTAAQWSEALERRGLAARVFSLRDRTPVANVIIAGRKPALEAVAS